MGLGVADGQNGQLHRAALAGDEPQSARAGLSQPQRRHRAGDHVGLHRNAAAPLAMVHAHAAQHGLSVGDGDVERAVMPQQHGVAQIIHGHDLGKRPAHAQQIADLHGRVGLEIALAGAGHALGGQKRMAHDEAALNLLVMVAVRAVIIIGKRVQPAGLYQPLLRGGHAARPVELRLGGLAGDGIRRRIAADYEEFLHLGALFEDLRVRDLHQLVLQIAHLQ